MCFENAHWISRSISRCHRKSRRNTSTSISGDRCILAACHFVFPCLFPLYIYRYASDSPLLAGENSISRFFRRKRPNALVSEHDSTAVYKTKWRNTGGKRILSFSSFRNKKKKTVSRFISACFFSLYIFSFFTRTKFIISQLRNISQRQVQVSVTINGGISYIENVISHS